MDAPTYWRHDWADAVKAGRQLAAQHWVRYRVAAAQHPRGWQMWRISPQHEEHGTS